MDIIPEGKALVHIEAGQYQFIEYLVPCSSLEMAQKYSDEVKESMRRKKYSCDHLFAEKAQAKSGQYYRKCPDCGAMQFQNEDSNWSMWNFPVEKDRR